MKSCSSTLSEKNRRKRNVNGRRETEKNSRISKSVLASFLSSLIANNMCRAVAARTSAVNNPPLTQPTSSSAAAVAKPKPPPVKKEVKKQLKGVVVKKKAKPAVSKTADAQVKPSKKDKPDEESKDDAPPDPKRRRLDS